MPCYHPIRAFRSRTPNSKTGKFGVVFSPRGSDPMQERFMVPCGQCIGCRLERSRQWALRCMHEASLFENNCFITLTYDDDHLPARGCLEKKDFQDFMKRLRKMFCYYPYVVLRPQRRRVKVLHKEVFIYARRIRYLHCGEYGERFGRPHAHACLFNFDFGDKVPIQEVNGYVYYESEVLRKLWGKGHVILGGFSFETAAYVARYITKKVTGESAFLHYNVVDFETGELLQERVPEYITMSRRPGIGYEWYKKYGKSDVYVKDFVTRNGIPCHPPKFYDSKYEIDDPVAFERIKAKRVNNALLVADDNTAERLLVKEAIKKQAIKSLKRSFEDGK